MITASAPGKLLLMGEHAVVYGLPCIVTAIDKRLSVSIEETKGSGVVIDAPQVNDTRFVARAIEVAKKHWQKPLPALSIHTSSEFSSRYGFGSSSAVVVATIFALQQLVGKKENLRDVFEMAHETIREVQGTGSGFDAAAATIGGTLVYGNGGNVLEKIETDTIPLVIGYTGVKADTTSLIAAVAQKKHDYPKKVNRIFEAIGKLVVDVKPLVAGSDWERVGKLMDFNQEYLRDLGVSGEKLEALISAAKHAGAWGAKLSGAGGGDCMIALAPPERLDSIVRAIQEAGGEVVEAAPGAAGVRLETTDDQEELFVVVDENDAIIGHKTRGECHRDKTLIHRTVGVLVYDKSGRLLLQKRSRTKDTEPGKWAISVSGHVTRGQSYEEAAERELNEELGITVPMTFVKKFIVHQSFETEMASLYKATSNGPFRPHPQEIDEIRFFSVPELAKKVKTGEIALSGGARITLRAAGVLS